MKSQRIDRSRWSSAWCILAFCLLGTSGAVAQDATSSPTPPPSSSILDFPGRRAYHQAAGWASTGLLAAAGAVGTWRALDLMNRGHAYRKAHGIDEEDDQAIAAALSSIWTGGQTLRWVHVGLLAAGETLYLGNAITGLAMKLPKGERSLAADIHLVAFFTHAALMASQVIIGVMGTDALRRGDHEAHNALMGAHVAVGVAIPIVMAGAGVATSLDLSFLEKK
jgi:hypothetical protein